MTSNDRSYLGMLQEAKRILEERFQEATRQWDQERAGAQQAEDDLRAQLAEVSEQVAALRQANETLTASVTATTSQLEATQADRAAQVKRLSDQAAELQASLAEMHAKFDALQRDSEVAAQDSQRKIRSLNASKVRERRCQRGFKSHVEEWARGADEPQEFHLL